MALRNLLIEAQVISHFVFIHKAVTKFIKNGTIIISLFYCSKMRDNYNLFIESILNRFKKFN